MAKKILVNYDFNQNQILNVALQVLASAPGTPVIGQVYYNSTSNKFFGWNGTAWIDLSNLVGATDLSFTRDGTTVTVTSSTGNNAILPAATTALAGVMSGGDKTKLDGVAVSANNYAHPNHSGDVTSVADGVTTIAANAVTNTKAADMATSTIKGRVTAATGDPEDLTPTQVRTLINVENGADVTDATNVAAAGAVMEADTTTALMQFVIDEDTFASDLATKVPTQQSVKAYVTAQIGAAVAGGMNFMGAYDAATDSPGLDGVGIQVVNETGDAYVVTVAGMFFSESVQVGDLLIAKQAAADALGNWVIVNKNIPDIVSSSETEQGIIELATQTEVNTGTDAVRAVTPLTLQTKLTNAGYGTVNKFTGTIGNGVLTSIPVTHSLGQQWVTAQVYEVATLAQVECDIVATSTTVTTFIFNVAPTTNQYRVVITG